MRGYWFALTLPSLTINGKKLWIYERQRVAKRFWSRLVSRSGRHRRRNRHNEGSLDRWRSRLRQVSFAQVSYSISRKRTPVEPLTSSAFQTTRRDGSHLLLSVLGLPRWSIRINKLSRLYEMRIMERNAHSRRNPTSGNCSGRSVNV